MGFGIDWWSASELLVHERRLSKRAPLFGSAACVRRDAPVAFYATVDVSTAAASPTRAIRVETSVRHTFRMTRKALMALRFEYLV